MLKPRPSRITEQCNSAPHQDDTGVSLSGGLEQLAFGLETRRFDFVVRGLTGLRQRILASLSSTREESSRSVNQNALDRMQSASATCAGRFASRATVRARAASRGALVVTRRLEPPGQIDHQLGDEPWFARELTPQHLLRLRDSLRVAQRLPFGARESLASNALHFRHRRRATGGADGGVALSSCVLHLANGEDRRADQDSGALAASATPARFVERTSGRGT
jgi:hypothetical protein